jgi:hypothetical protein
MTLTYGRLESIVLIEKKISGLCTDLICHPIKTGRTSTRCGVLFLC